MIEAFLKSHTHFRRNGDGVEGCVLSLIDGCTFTVPVVICVFSDAPPHVSIIPTPGIAVCPTPHVTAQGDVIAATIPSLAAWRVGSGLAAVYEDLRRAFSSNCPIREASGPTVPSMSQRDTTAVLEQLRAEADAARREEQRQSERRLQTREARQPPPVVAPSNGDTSCVVCLTEPQSHVFIPCGHMCCCGACAEKLTSCCICRAAIASCVRVFQS